MRCDECEWWDDISDGDPDGPVGRTVENGSKRKT